MPKPKDMRFMDWLKLKKETKVQQSLFPTGFCKICSFPLYGSAAHCVTCKDEFEKKEL